MSTAGADSFADATPIGIGLITDEVDNSTLTTDDFEVAQGTYRGAWWHVTIPATHDPSVPVQIDTDLSTGGSSGSQPYFAIWDGTSEADLVYKGGGTNDYYYYNPGDQFYLEAWVAADTDVFGYVVRIGEQIITTTYGDWIQDPDLTETNSIANSYEQRGGGSTDMLSHPPGTYWTQTDLDQDVDRLIKADVANCTFGWHTGPATDPTNYLGVQTGAFVPCGNDGAWDADTPSISALGWLISPGAAQNDAYFSWTPASHPPPPDGATEQGHEIEGDLSPGLFRPIALNATIPMLVRTSNSGNALPVSTYVRGVSGDNDASGVPGGVFDPGTGVLVDYRTIGSTTTTAPLTFTKTGFSDAPAGIVVYPIPDITGATFKAGPAPPIGSAGRADHDLRFINDLGTAPTFTWTLRPPRYRYKYQTVTIRLGPPPVFVRTWLRETQRGDKAGAAIRTVQNNSQQNSLRNIGFR